MSAVRNHPEAALDETLAGDTSGLASTGAKTNIVRRFPVLR